MDDKMLLELEAEKKAQAEKALRDLEIQKKEVEDQKAKMLEEAGAIADSLNPLTAGNTGTTILSDDELQALGDTINGSEIVEEKTLEEAQREVSKLQAETALKVEHATNLTIDEVKQQIEDAYKKQMEALELQSKEKEDSFKRQLEEMKMAQMSSKEKEEYRKLQIAKDEAEKMSKMAELVEQLKRERTDQEDKISEMQKKAKDIAYIRNQLKEQPWMADVVQQLKIDTEDDFKKASVLSGQIKKWKDLEKKDLENGNRNVFGRISGGQMSDTTKKKTDDLKNEMDNLLASVIIK